MNISEARESLKAVLAASRNERRRIRRLIAPHLLTLWDMWPHLDRINRGGMSEAIAAIDAATRAPKKGAK